jgi:hypothetical protein
MLPAHAPLPETVLIRQPCEALSIVQPTILVKMGKKKWTTTDHREIGMLCRHESLKTKHPRKHLEEEKKTMGSKNNQYKNHLQLAYTL